MHKTHFDHFDESFSQDVKDCPNCQVQNKLCQQFREIKDEQGSKMQTISFEQRMKLVEIMLSYDQEASQLSFRCRLWLWRYSTNCNNMMSVYKKYVKELKDMNMFANSSFAQIELDLPRMQFFKHQ